MDSVIEGGKEMTRDEAIKLLELLTEFAALEASKECYKLAIEALKQIRAIESIIDVSNLTIQEDVLKYKMIVDVVKGKG